MGIPLPSIRRDRRTGLAGPRPAALFVEIVLGGGGGVVW